MLHSDCPMQILHWSNFWQRKVLMMSFFCWYTLVNVVSRQWCTQITQCRFTIDQIFVKEKFCWWGFFADIHWFMLLAANVALRLPSADSPLIKILSKKSSDDVFYADIHWFMLLATNVVLWLPSADSPLMKFLSKISSDDVFYADIHWLMLLAAIVVLWLPNADSPLIKFVSKKGSDGEFFILIYIGLCC